MLSFYTKKVMLETKIFSIRGNKRNVVKRESLKKASLFLLKVILARVYIPEEFVYTDRQSEVTAEDRF